MNLDEFPHKRFNPLTGQWVLVSPHRMKRPWQGRQDPPQAQKKISYDKDCYLCPSNTRADGSINPDYKKSFSFTNDFSALLPEEIENNSILDEKIFKASYVRGLCRVICFSPRHDLTLAKMSIEEIKSVIELWQKEFKELSAKSWIKNIIIFENKGEIMGCSNPHPHGQIWAQSDFPNEIINENSQQLEYYNLHKKNLLDDYQKLEVQKNERVLFNNNHFLAMIPFWATWPFEVIIIGKTPRENILQFSSEEVSSLAQILSKLTICYDNLFETSFAYSAGMHQAPVNSGPQPHWQWHMHFYPPLLRSASIKKFMVGYELLGGPQRDITPEVAAAMLKAQSEVHYEMR